MSAVVVAEVQACVDCIMTLANGELGQGDETADREHAERMAGQWPPSEGYELAIGCDEDCEGTFSWSWCGGCGSTLGGDRHPVAVFQTTGNGQF